MIDEGFDMAERRVVVTGASAGIGAAIALRLSRAGLAAATVALAKEWRHDGIRVTQVDPGIVDTSLAAEVVAELTDEGFGVNLVGRAGTGDEIAGLVHYLVAPSDVSPPAYPSGLTVAPLPWVRSTLVTGDRSGARAGRMG